MKRQSLSAVIMTLMIFGAALPSMGGFNTWSGTGPLTTGLGNRNINSFVVSTDGKALYAGTGSGTVFSYTVTPPSSVTSAATSVVNASATLNGTVNANDADATVSFDYGTTTAYGTNVAAVPVTVTGTSTTVVSAALVGLTPSTIYHYRVVATNSSGTSYGDDTILTTTPLPVNGTCGDAINHPFKLAPAANLCTNGNPSSVTSALQQWQWSCGGINNGTTSNCTAVKDVDGPTLTVSTLANNDKTNNATLNISGTVTDASGVASLTINTVPVTITSGTYSYPVTLLVGDNAITVVATDTLGNITTNTRNVTLDQTAPALTVTAPADNSKTAQVVATVTGTINETSTVTVKLNNGSPLSASITGSAFSATLNLISGLNTITTKATDLAGNTTTVVRSVTYDNSNPSVAITNPNQDFTTIQNRITISGTVTDTITNATVSISFNNQTLTPTVTSGAFSQLLTLPSVQTWPIVATATDETGNTATATRNIIYALPTISDALKALQSVVGTTTLTASELIRYDVAPLDANYKPVGNGTVDIADVIMILRRSIGMEDW